MKIICPECGSELLDQGINGVILCHECKRFWGLYKEITPRNQLADE